MRQRDNVVHEYRLHLMRCMCTLFDHHWVERKVELLNKNAHSADDDPLWTKRSTRIIFTGGSNSARPYCRFWSTISWAGEIYSWIDHPFDIRQIISELWRNWNNGESPKMVKDSSEWKTLTQHLELKILFGFTGRVLYDACVITSIIFIDMLNLQILTITQGLHTAVLKWWNRESAPEPSQFHSNEYIDEKAFPIFQPVYCRSRYSSD